MKKLTKKAIASLVVGTALAFVAVVSPLAAPMVGAACDTEDVSISGGVNCAQGNSTSVTLFGDDSLFTTIINVMLFIIGAISVVMIIIGGIRYAVSSGNSTSVTGAKNTILYAVVGLIVAFLAFAIVNWVLKLLVAPV